MRTLFAQALADRRATLLAELSALPLAAAGDEAAILHGRLRELEFWEKRLEALQTEENEILARAAVRVGRSLSNLFRRTP